MILICRDDYIIFYTELQSGVGVPPSLIHYYEFASNKVLRNKEIFDFVLFREVLITSPKIYLKVSEKVISKNRQPSVEDCRFLCLQLNLATTKICC